MGKKTTPQRWNEINTSVMGNRYVSKLGTFAMEIIRSKWTSLDRNEQNRIVGRCGLGTKQGTKGERDYRRFAVAVGLLGFVSYTSNQIASDPSIRDPRIKLKTLENHEIAGYIRRCLARANHSTTAQTQLMKKIAINCWSHATGGSSSARIKQIAKVHVIRPGDGGIRGAKHINPPKYFSEKQTPQSPLKGIWDATPRNGAPIRIYPIPSMNKAEPFGAHTSTTRPNEAITNHLTAYYLPWQPGWCVKYNIPQNAGNNALFLTSALSGCSIFIRGPATNPTVYHCGMMPDYWRVANVNKLKVPSTGNAADAHNLALKTAIENKRSHDLFKLIVEREGAVNAGIRSSDYSKGNVSCQACGNNKSTSQMERIHKLLQRLLRNRRLLDGAAGECSGFGAVYGVKKNGQWKFYLQGGINVNIISPDGLHRWLFSQPTHIQRFYPNNQTNELSLASDLDYLNERMIDTSRDS